MVIFWIFTVCGGFTRSMVIYGNGNYHHHYNLELTSAHTRSKTPHFSITLPYNNRDI